MRYHWTKCPLLTAFFLFLLGYFSPRRDNRRVLKFCVWFKVTTKLRFGVKQNLGDPQADGQVCANPEYLGESFFSLFRIAKYWITKFLISYGSWLRKPNHIKFQFYLLGTNCSRISTKKMLYIHFFIKICTKGLLMVHFKIIFARHKNGQFGQFWPMSAKDIFMKP